MHDPVIGASCIGLGLGMLKVGTMLRDVRDELVVAASGGAPLPMDSAADPDTRPATVGQGGTANTIEWKILLVICLVFVAASGLIGVGVGKAGLKLLERHDR